ncbi:copper amine oxidase-like protein [Gottschalkia acidurici 9a]|uniref:Copper amine oxidase-like protein n=1 Tax=Gottschalkia acidurici (strain ATCC 7906 / DSM 604 / BCRC 14475 / CIP 104303 / KCTC 5404 / NCIMB 10678 / 9a) TaxID=1128398 RepID=K0B0V8_GOTA9|nr:stalk domain-containing protein [Gottschalkia acidurici]AFS79658.1 copper amine oxidase-like protein [Gottschalkia acidurici 9a]
MIRRGIIVIILALNFAMISNTTIASMENNGDILIKVNGKFIEFDDEKPFINSDYRALVPLQFIVNELGAEADWIFQSQTIRINTKKEVSLNIGAYKAIVNSEEVNLDPMPTINNGKVFVPLRFISETLGFHTEWDDKDSIINIYKIEKLIEIDSLTFFEQTRDNLIYFGRPTCPYCQEFEYHLKKTLEDKNVTVYYFNSDYWREKDGFEEIVNKYDVRYVPYLVKLKNGVIQDSLSLNDRTYEKEIKDHIEAFISKYK